MYNNVTLELAIKIISQTGFDWLIIEGLVCKNRFFNDRSFDTELVREKVMVIIIIIDCR